MNPLEQAIDFVTRLREAGVPIFRLGMPREALMVAILTATAYIEVEFFPDGHVETQTWGPASEVEVVDDYGASAGKLVDWVFAGRGSLSDWIEEQNKAPATKATTAGL
jgi:hypothetical protein